MIQASGMSGGSTLNLGVAGLSNGAEYVGYPAREASRSRVERTPSMSTCPRPGYTWVTIPAAAELSLGVAGRLQIQGSSYGAFEIVGYSGSGAFIQTGGVNTVSDYNGGNLILGRNPGQYRNL